MYLFETFTCYDWAKMTPTLTPTSNVSYFKKKKLLIVSTLIDTNVCICLRHPILDTRISSVLLLLRPSGSYYPPWILKRAGLESYGQIASSKYWKTKRIAFFFVKKKEQIKKKKKQKSEFLRLFEIFWDLRIFDDLKKKDFWELL